MATENDMHAPRRNLIEQLADAKNLISEIMIELNDARRQMAELAAANQRLEQANAERGAVFAELRRVLDGKLAESEAWCSKVVMRDVLNELHRTRRSTIGRSGEPEWPRRN